MYLTLPIPVASRWKHDIYFVTWDLERPNYKVSLFCLVMLVVCAYAVL